MAAALRSPLHMSARRLHAAGPQHMQRSLVRVYSSGPSEVWSVQEAQDLLKKGYKYVDVRTPEEFQGGRVPGAVNLPLSPQLGQVFKEKFPDANNIILGCQAGNRSTMALQLLAQNGVKLDSIVNFKGGWSAWVGSGQPVEK